MFDNCRKVIAAYREQSGKLASAFTLAWEAECELNKAQDILLFPEKGGESQVIPTCESCIASFGKCEFKREDADCKTFWKRVGK